jgi:hypothetical protein
MKKATIGWREWVALPDLGVDAIKAKVDTGARTSALHAYRLEVSNRDGEEYAEFEIHPVQRQSTPSIRARVPIVDWKTVRSSNGRSERRPVIHTTIGLGERSFETDIALTNRDEMGFRMLLGRQAVRAGYLIDPGRSYLAGS